VPKTVDELIVEITRKKFSRDATTGQGYDHMDAKPIRVTFEGDDERLMGSGKNLEEAIRDLAKQLGIE
jgi:hypothetical protein